MSLPLKCPSGSGSEIARLVASTVPARRRRLQQQTPGSEGEAGQPNANDHEPRDWPGIAKISIFIIGINIFGNVKKTILISI